MDLVRILPSLCKCNILQNCNSVTTRVLTLIVKIESVYITLRLYMLPFYVGHDFHPPS